MYNFTNVVNYLSMINLAKNKILPNPILKQNIKFNLKALDSIESIKIFTMPSKIKDRDIMAMFNGLLTLLREKVQQEQSEKYLRLKLKYDRLKLLYYKKRYTTNPQ